MDFFKNITNPLTTATAVGATTRYAISIISGMVTILGVLGLLDAQQQAEVAKAVPELVTGIAGIITVLLPLYGILTKSNSDKAQAAAKLIDAELPKSSPVVIQTPSGKPDIVVPAKV